jgi:hypothetical protein
MKDFLKIMNIISNIETMINSLNDGELEIVRELLEPILYKDCLSSEDEEVSEI